MRYSPRTTNIVLTPDERLMLNELAHRIYRTKSETVALLVRGALEAIREQEAKERANDQKELQPA